MKKTMLVVVLVVLLMTSLFAAERHTGIGAGLTVGYPAGLTGRYDLDGFRVVGNLSTPYGSGIYLDAGALFPITEVDIADMPFFIDAGAQLSIGANNSAFYFTVNGLANMSWYVETMPVEVFVYLAPGIRIAPGIGFDFKGGLGALYYF